MDLLPTPEQDQIIAAVREVLSTEAIRRKPLTAAHWRELAELGWLALGLPESRGGSGWSIVEEALLCRELGRATMPPSLIATLLAAHVVDEPNLLSGTTRVAFVAGHYVVDDHEATLGVEIAESSVRILRLDSARKRLAALDETLGLAVLDRTASPVVGESGPETVVRALALLAAALTGVAEGVCALSVQYAQTRQQFGQPIGAFQAIKHACANMAIRCESAWSQTAFACLTAREQPENALQEVAAALRMAERSAIDNAEAAIQVHGAIGFSSEAEPHRFVKCAQTLARIGCSRERIDHLLIGAAA